MENAQGKLEVIDMKQNIIRFAPSIAVSMLFILVSFAILDFIWLGLIAGEWYQSEMRNLLRTDFVAWPWLVFYLVYGGVTFVLAVVANRDKSMSYAAIDGALLGLASYGTYNLTNYSIVEGYSLSLALTDWVWGVTLTSLCAIAGWSGFQIMRKYKSTA